MSGAEGTPQQMEARVKTVAEQLRCVVCQNQTIADSHAELAIDLRAQIREQVAQGRRDEQILAYMAERYGAYVLYKPPVNAATALLWAGPAVMLVGGALAMGLAVRRRGRRPVTQPSDRGTAP
jgi:cytochrome c-type biogenesis protein CcmH